MAEQPPRKRSRPRDSAPAESPRRHKRPTTPKPATVSETAAELPATPVTILPEPDIPPVEEPPFAEPALPAVTSATRRGREGEARSNALGLLIERRFADPAAPVRSYSDLERRSGVSREALSRYVTARADRRRSPTIETLAAIADALRISLEQVCRAAVAGAHGQLLPDAIEQRAREEVLMPLAGALSDSQFDALVELLRQMQRRAPGG